eukprot:122103_1
MSTWIHITNLPLYYDHYGLHDIFGDIGQIIATKVTKDEMILKSTGFVQFASPKHAKLAASKKDQTVIANSAVRVYLVWTPDEDLSTVRVENIPAESTTTELEQYFDPYGEIVNTTINQKTSHALISFCRVDYALNAVQEMNGTIIDSCGALKVTLTNPDARNLKWKRNSFEYKHLPIPPTHEHITNHSGRYPRHKHPHHRHKQQRDRNYMKQQYQTNNNANIIIVNNINSMHGASNPDETKTMQNELLHPQYRRHQHFNDNKRGRGRHRTYGQTHNHHEDRYHRHRHDTNHDHPHHRHHHRRYPEENHRNKHNRRPRKHRSGRSITAQSTLLGPIPNFSNGQYHTYSVTPSPTRSMTDSNDSLPLDHQPHHLYRTGLQRMNSADSSSSNCSAQSFTASNYPNRQRKALDRYGFPSKQVQNHHSPQPYQPQPVVHVQTPRTPVSPATTVSSISTPSTTHSVPTPTGYVQHNMISRSKTPTPFIIHTPTLSKSASTPPSASTLVNPMFAPQTNLNAMNTMNMNMNMITNQLNTMTMNPNLNGMLSPNTLMLPLESMHANPNKSPPSVTSPIVLTPTTNLLLQQQLVNNQGLPSCTQPNANIPNPNLLSPNMQQPFTFNSSPFNTPPDPQKHFVFEKQRANDMSPQSTSRASKKGKKSPSHSWTKEEEELGNKCYKIIEAKYPQRATKIVGMALTANTTEEITFMIEHPHILLTLARDYDQQQRIKELNKTK